VRVTFSAVKDAINRRKHDISLQRAEDFDFDTAIFLADTREDYGEERWVAIGLLDIRLYHLTFVYLDEQHIRPISFRKATTKEISKYETESS
jgi:uncharacterized DUF497 family protein